MKLNKVLVLVTLVVFACSCNNDDDGDETTEVEQRILSEVAIEDDAEIIEYLKTHFYNYEEFETASADFDYLIEIDTIAGDNADKVSIFNSDRLKSEVIKLDSDIFGLDEEETDVEHTLYYLIANEGEGVAPTPLDSTYVLYEGSTLDNTVFDENLRAPVWFDLLSTVSGFGRGVAQLNAGGEVIENGDGTFDIVNPGSGALFMPSALAYFSSTIPGESYAPLIFKIKLFSVEESDHDQDGVPTWIEDLDGDFDVTNDDTDEDGFPDYFDTDDDGDGVSTNTEIRNDDDEFVDPYPDTDGDGIPDYLDEDNN